MFRTTTRSALLALTLTASALGAAKAGPAYTADQIVSHFAHEPDLGPSRGLCIGTESECARTVPSRPKVSSGFDLVVTFEYNSDNLTPAAKANLDEFAKALRDARLGSAAFAVEGHTDGRGGEEFNLDLSTRRAGSVVQYLAGQGVPPEKLEAKGYGKLRPRSADPLDPANRRVETRLRMN